MRARNVEGGRDLLLGEAVGYSLAAGSMGVEAVRVRPLEPLPAER
jgi:hypothetical protein